MSTQGHRFTVSARTLRRGFAFALAAALLPASSTRAGTTVLQFSQTNASDVVTASVAGGVTTLSTMGNADGFGVSIPVTLSNFDGAPFPPGILVYETFVGVTSTDGVDFSGKIEFTSAPGGTGFDYLTATFSDAIFSGKGNSASLNATAPGVTFVSDQAGFPTGNPGFSIAFSGILPPLTGPGTAFTAQNAGTFSASVVPEPSTLCLTSVALAIGGIAAFRRKKTSVEG